MAKAVRAATIPAPTGTSGPIPSPMARRRTTGCRSLAARPGNGTPARAVLSAQLPDLTAGSEFPQPCDVQDALLDVARFWLERGVDGFRLDTINFYFHDAELRSNPALPPRQRNASIAPSVNPYNHQAAPLFQEPAGKPRVPGTVPRADWMNTPSPRLSGRSRRCAARRWRSWANTPPVRSGVHMCYAFELPESQGRADSLQIWPKCLERWTACAANGWACWAFSNHDVIRHAAAGTCLTRRHNVYAHGDDVPARLSLPLSGRGTGSARSGRRL